MNLPHYDSLTLAREHLRQAEALFHAVERLLENPAITERVEHAQRLAVMGITICQEAADDFGEQAQAFKDREVQS